MFISVRWIFQTLQDSRYLLEGKPWPFFVKFRSKIKKTIFVHSYIVLDKIHGIGLLNVKINWPKFPLAYAKWELFEAVLLSFKTCNVLPTANVLQTSNVLPLNTKSMVNSEQNWTELIVIVIYFYFLLIVSFVSFFLFPNLVISVLVRFSRGF